MGKGVEEEEDSILLKRLQESVDATPNDAKLRFDLGVCLWERRGEREKAVEHFVISAKLDPQNGAVFKYLGHYYSRVSSGDNQRAIKCYQRAVTVNPDDDESGEAVCDLLDQEGRESLEVAVCKDASEKSARAFWAYRRLGYLQVHQKKWSEAVQSLQHAIRGYHSCADLWEGLGLAYQQLGMYTAAVKSYGRAIELDETRVFARIESGNIFMMLGSFKKGIEQFEQTLEIAPRSLSAHYGLASGLFGQSKECITMGAFQWAALLLEEASKVAIAGTRLAGNMSSLWKLHGDVQLTYAKCLPWRSENQASEFDMKNFKASVYQWNESRYLAAKSARTSYQKALHLAPWLANIYADIAICSDLIYTLSNASGANPKTWQLHEKMALGALLLDGDNYELWVTLGCLSDHNALKQHAFIRSLQLDVAVAIAWACLGKLYREMGEKVLARQAFDSARSIDPFLSLPWAGMSADFRAGEDAPGEAFDGCLRAVQTLPLPEFQTGLAKLALLSGNSSSSQVFGAICQAVERAPFLPESHNLKGLICEARLDYQSAVASYRLTLHAIGSFAENLPKSRIRDVKINLIRTLSKAGNVQDAVKGCEDLKEEGALDTECLHIYAFSLWQLGQNTMSLAVAKNLAANIPAMEKASMSASASFICRLLYSISGQDSAVKSILKMPKEFFQSPKISFVVSAINSLDENDRLNPVVSASRQFLTSHDDITKMHFLIGLSKLVKTGSDFCLGYKNGLHHLRKALHMFPDSELLRQSLGYLLLSSRKLNDCHLATRCCMSSSEFLLRGLKSSCEILGAGAVACYGIGNSRPRFSYPTCSYQCFSEPQTIQQLQKYLRHEPWNHSAWYLLILNLLQKAREERFPWQLCNVIRRVIHVALSNDLYLNTDLHYQYEKCQLLLCASEISFQLGNQSECISYARNASKLKLPDGYLFFAHLLLCRAFAVEGRLAESRNEYLTCLKLGTDLPIGWICLKFMEVHFDVEANSSTLELEFSKCLDSENWHIWMAIFHLASGLASLWSKDFVSAENFLEQACSLMVSESCIFLCHGVACMELARQGQGSNFLSLAVRSLTKAHESSFYPLPIVSALLAQAEGSLGSKKNWVQNVRSEWFTWSPEMRPAELFLLMHLLACCSEAGSESESSVEMFQSPIQWVCRAIHINPSCLRYWKVLQKLVEVRSDLPDRT